MANPNVTSFSLSHAAILDGTTAAEVADLYGVNDGSLEIETDSAEITGDDRIMSTARWVNKATISLKSNYIPFDLMALLYNTPVVSGAEGLSMQLWTEKSMNVAPRPVLVQAPGEDQDGNPFTMKFVLYKVRFGPISIDSFMSYKEHLAISFDGDALLSEKDELGAAFTDNLGARIGKIVAVSLA